MPKKAKQQRRIKDVQQDIRILMKKLYTPTRMNKWNKLKRELKTLRKKRKR